MRKFSEIVRLPEFERDMKKLSKRYRTLEEDLENLINSALYPYHKMNVVYGGIFPVSYLKIGQHNYYKVTQIACRSLSGTGKRSGLRLIYAFYEETDTIELIEIYHKSDKDNENKKRILAHHKKRN